MLPAGSQDLCGTCSMDEGRTWLGKAKRSNKFSSIGNQVPLYMTLGLAVAFALTFSIVDVLNYVIGFFQNSVAKPVVESSQQVFLVLIVSLAMGVVFGFTFGLLDVEDEEVYHMRVALMREEHYCYPMGIL
eukprot:symbB.v1.2.040446.t1/scaffold7241.1/size12382/1